MKSKTRAVGLIGILMFFWLAGSVPQAQAVDPALFSAMNLVRLTENAEFPDVRLPNLEGQVVPLRSFRGKVLLLNFWTTW
jgi:hypothetical protein